MEVEYHHKTKALKRYFDQKSRDKMRCSSCKEKTSSDKFWERIKECVGLAEKHGSKHVAEQVQNKDDIFYQVCPNCEEGAKFV